MKRPTVRGHEAGESRRSNKIPRIVTKKSSSEARPRGIAPRIRDESKRFQRTTLERRRRRWILIGSSVGIVLIVIGISLSPLFTLKTIEVKGRSSVAEKVIAGAAVDQVGVPLALIDFESIRQRLTSVVKIQSFSTEIQPPDTLVIRVIERTPIGAIAVNGGWEVVDSAGVVIDSVKNAPTSIPELRVFGVDDPQFQNITQTLLLIPSDLRKRIGIIAAESRDSIRFTLRDLACEVVWGSIEGSQLKAIMLSRAIDELAKESGSYVIDVSAPENIVMRKV